MKQLEKLLKTLGNPALWALCHTIVVMKAFILCVKQSSSNVLLVRITNNQKQVSPSLFADSAPVARLFELPWALY